MNEFTYIYRINEEDDEWIDKDLSTLLPKWRIEKAEKLKNRNAQRESIMAGLLLVYALKDYSGLSQKEIIDALDSRAHDIESRMIRITGLHNIDSRDALYYSITHSGSYAAVAVSDKEVGIDIETKDDKGFKVTSRMFTEEDKAFIGESQDRFRMVWSLKESFLKCTGEGISVSLNSFTFDYNNEKIRRVISKGYDLQGRDYYAVTKSLDESEGAISICSSNPDLILDTKWVGVL